MRTIRILQRRLYALRHRSSADADLQREIEIHLQQLIREGREDGLSESEARTAALLEFGPVEVLKEECRDTRRVRWIQDLGQDLRYGARMLREARGFTAVAALTLALGIGANTAIFSIVDAALLRALPYPEADRLVVVSGVPVKRPDALSGISYRDFEEYRKAKGVFREMAGNAFHNLTLTGAGEPAVVNAAAVTPEIFSVLDTKALTGRLLRSEDGKRGAAAVAVVSEELWRNRFGSDAGLIGRAIALDMRSFTVVGILPASFRFPDGGPRQDVWIAVRQDPLFGPMAEQASVRLLGVVGRLEAGVSLEKAQAELNTTAGRLAKEFPAEDAGLGIRVRPYREVVVGNLRPALLILLGAVGLVLCLACANVANLQLSRATSRGREIAVRLALGASRARIVRQLLTESALLGLLGGAAGALLAAWAVRSFARFLPAEVARMGSVHVGGPVLGFALAVSLAAALGFGLAPALVATRSDLQASIKEGGERAGQRGGGRLRSVLAVAEIAVAMVLLVGGGLLIRSFALVTSVKPGFDAENVTEASVSLPQFRYRTPQQWREFAEELLARLHAQPGFAESALAAPLPMDRQGQASFPFRIVGAPPPPPNVSQTADYATVSPEYFRVMRIPLERGRFFSEQDAASKAPVAIISGALARRYFADQDPIGKQMRFGFPPNGNVAREIVGVVGDVRDVALSQRPGPMMYVPFAQAPLYGGEVVVRSGLGASSVAAGIREAAHAIDKDLPVTDVAALPDAVGGSVARERFRTLLLGAFGAMALVLAAVGIFGVMSYSASQRTHEIGIRMALGAERGDVLRLIVGQGARLAAMGLAIGAGCALLLTRSMATLLYGISATDPVTFGAVAAALFGAAVLACYIPARRAVRVDPVTALRRP